MKKLPKGILGNFILLFIIFLILPAIALAGPAGKFSYVEGRVDVLRPPAIRAIPVKIGDTVFVSDIIRAKSKSKAEITFINDNILRVAENTRVEISEYMFEEEKSSGVVKLSRGKVQAIVPEKIAKRIATFGEANRFEVRTPAAIAGVRGTDFFTFHHREVTGVLVKEGNVEVHNPKFPEVVVTVTAGNITIVPENKPPTPPRPATDAEIKGHEKDTVPTEKEKAEKEKAEKDAKEKLEKEKAEKEKADKEVEEKKKAEAEAKAKAEAEKEAEAKAKAEAEAKAATEARAKAEAEAKAKAEAVAKAEAEAKAATEAVKKVEAAAAAAEAEKARPVEIVARERAAVGEVVVAPVPEVPAPAPIAPVIAPAVVTEIPITEAVIRDTTPPVITITSKPASLTNSSTAGFGFLSTEPSTYSYRLDGGAWTTTTEGLNLSSLTEGSHTLEVKATDAAGNISTPVSYSWTTDYTAPVVSIPTAPATIANSPTVSFVVTFSELVTATYTIDNVVVTSPNTTSDTFTNAGLTEGSHTLEVKATDAAGNTSVISTYEWFIGTRQYALEGGVIGTLSGSISSGQINVISTQPVGAWLIDSSGSYTTMPSTLSLVAGGTGYGSNNTTQFDGYWLSDINANALNGNISGTSSLTYLRTTTLGTGTGRFSGLYDATTWQATDLGFGTYTEQPLAFGGSLEGGFLYWDPALYQAGNGNLRGLIGGTTSLWSGSPSFMSLGTYSNPNNRTLWGAYIGPQDIPAGWASDGSAILGSMCGIVLNDTFEGKALALYIRPTTGATGYIYSENVSGTLYHAIGMYEAEGNLTAVSMGTTTVSPSNLYWDSPYLEYGSGYLNIAGAISGGAFVEGLRILETPGDRGSALPWGIWRTGSGGSYTTIPTEAWESVAGIVSYDDTEMVDGYEIFHIRGGAWSPDGKFSATMSGKGIYISPLGYYADTGDSTGSILGVYGGGTWQARGGGIFTETPLAFGSAVGVLEEAGFLYWNGEEFLADGPTNPSGQVITQMTGLIGGTTDFWTTPESFTIMGKYDKPVNRTLWGIDIVSLLDPLYLEAPGANPCDFNIACQGLSSAGSLKGVGYHGLMGGISLGNTLEGKGLALYIKDGKAGYLRFDNISGNLYEGIGMWEATGTIKAVERGTTSVLPSQLYDGSEYLEWGDAYGRIAGALTGSVGLMSLTIVDQDWGILAAGAGGTYTGTPSPNLTAVVGGTDYDDLGNIEGYWLGNITGTDWSGGRLAGSMSGKSLGYDYMGTFSGDILGTYDGGNWQAVSLGTWSGTPLAFGGSLSWGKFGHVQEQWDTSSYISGLLGGTTSLWSGLPSALMIGQYSNPNAKTLWDLDISGRTADGGAFYISGGGFALLEEGRAIGLYIRPDGTGGYLAGYLTSSPISITTYPGISMWEASPTLTASSGVPTRVTPEQLYWDSPYLDVE